MGVGSAVHSRLSYEHRKLIEVKLQSIGYDRRRETERREGKELVRKDKEENHSLLSRGNNGRISKHKSRIAKHIDTIVENFGTKERTTVYHSFDELPEKERKSKAS